MLAIIVDFLGLIKNRHLLYIPFYMKKEELINVRSAFRVSSIVFISIFQGRDCYYCLTNDDDGGQRG